MGFAVEAVVAGFLVGVVGMGEVGGEEGHLAVVAKDGVGFLELGIDADAFIEDKAFALVVGATGFFKVF